MIKVNSVETDRMKLMSYTMNEDDYIIKLHHKANRLIFDDIDIVDFSVKKLKDRIKLEIDANMTIFWICWMKEPVVRVGIVYFSHIVPGMDAALHTILDVEGYKMYIRNSNNSIRVKVMDEASKIAISYMFLVLKLQRITEYCFVYNKPMINLCKRLGFKEEGIIRHGARVDGKPVDAVVLGLLREEVNGL